MSEVAIALVSGLLGGGFALLGVRMSNRMAESREKVAFRNATAIELANFENLVWNSTWIELNAELQRLRARLTISQVDSRLLAVFEKVTVACWRHIEDQRETTPEEHLGLSIDLSDARIAAQDAIVSNLIDGPDDDLEEVVQDLNSRLDRASA